MRAPLKVDASVHSSKGLAPWLAVPLAFLLWLGLYWDSALGMASIWARSDTFAHGMVVAPVSIWLAWRSRFWERGLVPQPGWTALWPTAMFGALWLVAILVSVAGLEHVAAVGVLVSALWFSLGDRLARILAFPLAFLFFAAPIGEFLVPPLMDYTAEFTVWALRLTGVPVYHEGLHFVLPNGRWSVIEACSGVRYLIASFMVGTLYAYLTYTKLRKRLIFIGFSIALPIVANWLRAYMIVMIGYLSDNQLAAGVDHLIYGWVFFGVVIFAMFWAGGFWRDPEPSFLPSLDPSVAARSGAPQAAAFGLMAVVLAAAPLAARIVAPVDAELRAEVVLPTASGGWQRVEERPAGYQPSFSGYRAEAFAAYRDESQLVSLWAMLYANQVAGKELVSWANHIVPMGSDDWILLTQGRRTLAIGEVMFVRLRGPTGDVDIYHWYQIGDKVIVNDVEATLRLGLARLQGAGDASIHAVLATPSESNGHSSAGRVEAFLSAHGDRLSEDLQRSLGSIH